MQLALPHENLLTQAMNNTQLSHAPTPCIHTEFVRQATIHQQKLAVELDEQSLTYAELLHYVQLLSLQLLSQYHVAAGDVVCQCVERSLSMVSSDEMTSVDSHCRLSLIIGNWYHGDRDGGWCVLSTITSRSRSATACTCSTNQMPCCHSSSSDKNETLERLDGDRY